MTLWRVAFLAMMCGVGGILGFWIADRGPPARLISGNPETRVIQPGHILRVRYVVDRSRQCATHIDRVLVDGLDTRFVLPDEDYMSAPGPMGVQTYAVAIRVPDEAAPGLGKVMSTITYRCNPSHLLWPIIGDVATVHFTIGFP